MIDELHREWNKVIIYFYILVTWYSIVELLIVDPSVFEYKI